KLVNDSISTLHSNGFRVKTSRNQSVIHSLGERLSFALQRLTFWLQGLTLLLCGCYMSISTAAPTTESSPARLDADYQQIITHAYRELTQKNQRYALPQPELKALLRQIEHAEQANNSELTVGFINANLSLLQK